MAAVLLSLLAHWLLVQQLIRYVNIIFDELDLSCQDFLTVLEDLSLISNRHQLSHSTWLLETDKCTDVFPSPFP